MAERETVTDDSQGVALAMLQELARYWAADYDWRTCEAKLNALPHFMTGIDGVETEAAEPEQPKKPKKPVVKPRKVEPPPPVATPAPPPPAPPPLIVLRTIERNDARALLDSEVQKPDGKVVGRAVDHDRRCERQAARDGRESAGLPRRRRPQGQFPVERVPLHADREEPRRSRSTRRPRRRLRRNPPRVQLPLIDANVERSNGAKVGRVIDVLIDANAQPQAVVLDVNGMVSTERRTIAAELVGPAFRHERQGTASADRSERCADQRDAAIRQRQADPRGVAGASSGSRSCRCGFAPRRLRLPRGFQRTGGPMTGRTLVTARSLRALDWLNFFVANVQTGFGPFIASYLASHKWTQGEIGMALSVGTISAMVSQVPGGAAVDALRNKKGAAAWAIFAIILSAVLLAASPTVLPVIAAEVFHGFASCMLTPAMAAISFALVGRANLGDRLGRNARWASIGSAVAAGLMGVFGEYLFAARGVLADRCARRARAVRADMIQRTDTIELPKAGPTPEADRTSARACASCCATSAC